MKLKFFIVLLLTTQAALAADAGQLVPDAIEGYSELEADIKNIDEDDLETSYLPEAIPGLSFEEEEELKKQGYLSGEGEMKDLNVTKRQELNSFGQKVAGDPGFNTNQLVEADNRAIYKDFGRTQSSAFSFYYVRDDYDVTDSRGVFQRTYVDDNTAVRGGTLMFSYDRNLINSWVNMSYGVNFGVGLSQGRGIFADGQRSDTEFSLWTLPLELALSFEIPVSTWFDLAIEGGPSALGLYQVRSDFEQGAKGKRRRQVGTGYFAEARFKLSLSNIFRKTAFDYFSEYRITNTTLDLIARVQDYGNFQDDISISGQSLGIGFTFDFL